MVECPVAVVGAVDASSEISEMVDSSKLTPTIAGFIFPTRGPADYRERRDMQ